jgi:acetyltransferase-like isoleucine patch superfamily enzyme
MHFVSSKAKIKGFFESEGVVLGPSTVAGKTVIGKDVVIGYPSKKSIQRITLTKDSGIEAFDKVSKGASIGRNCYIRSGSVIYEDVVLGDYVQTGHNVLIRSGSVVGDRTLVGSSVKLDGAVKVGRNVSIQSDVYLPHHTVVEDNVFLAPHVVVTNDPYPPSKRLIGIVVEKGAVVGANAVIVARVKIGRDSVVAAGAIVTHDVPADKVVAGVPAKVVTSRKEYDKKRARWEKAEE